MKGYTDLEMGLEPPQKTLDMGVKSKPIQYYISTRSKPIKLRMCRCGSGLTFSHCCNRNGAR